MAASAYISTGPGGDSSWYWENPLPQGNDVLAQSFVSSTTGWAVGKNGLVLKTIDGGATWNYQDPQMSSDQRSQKDLNGVAFADANRGWIVGGTGIIKKTIDGGSTWTTQTASAGLSGGIPRAVASYDASRAIVVGANGRISFTTDGGTTWRDPVTNPVAANGFALNAASWATSTTAYAVGENGEIIRTTNGGSTWAVLSSSGYSVSLTGVSFASPTTGFIVGNNNNGGNAQWTVLRTVDSGATWTAVASQQNVQLLGVDMVDANICIISGANGAVYKTLNASVSSVSAVTWSNLTIGQMSGPSLSIRAVQMADATHAWVVGDAGSMFSSTDGGVTWSTQSASTNSNLMASWFTDSSRGWIAGASGTLERTSNGGSAWQGTNVGIATWRGLSMANATNGVVVGDAGAIRVTTDGGATWTSKTSGATGQLNGVWAMPTGSGMTTAVAVGAAGAILRTTNGGTTWTSQTVGSQGFSSVYFSDAIHGWAVANSSRIYYTANGGTTWTRQTAPSTGRTLNAVRGIAGTNNVWIVGNAGTLWSTANGTTWTSLASGTTQNLYSVCFQSTSLGWVAGAAGTVRYWNGSTWSNATSTGLPSGTTMAVHSIWFADANTGFFFADGGTVRKSTDGGRNWASQQYGTYAQLNAIAFPDTLHGWIAGNSSSGLGVVLASTDGGNVWFQQTSGATTNLSAVSFADSLNGWVVGTSGSIRHTADGGNTWAAQTSGTTSQLNGVAARSGDALHAIAAGSSGTIRYTADAGSTWSVATVPTLSATDTVQGIVFASSIATPGLAYAVTGHTAGNGHAGILRSTNYGAAWTTATVTTQPVMAISFAPAPDADVGWAVGALGTVFKTSDRGYTWAAQTSPISTTLNAVSAVTSQSAYATGQYGFMMQTGNGGTTWLSQNSGWGSLGSTAYLYGMKFTDPNHGFAVGAAGTILRTTSQSAAHTTLTTVPPTPNGDNGWYAPDGPSIFLAPDQQAQVYYSWDSSVGPFAAYTGSLLGPEGKHTLFYYSINAANKIEAKQSAAFWSDTVAPSAPTSQSATALDQQSVKVGWAPGTDAVSGIGYYEIWYTSTLSPTPSLATTVSAIVTSATITGLTPNTTYSLWVDAVDGAGNSSINGPTTVFATTLAGPALATVLTTAPAGPNGDNDWYVTTPTVTLLSTPASVTANTFFAWGSAAVSTYTAPFAPSSGGIQTVSYWSIDQLHQRAQEATQHATFKIDTTPPSTPATITGSAQSTASVALTWEDSVDAQSGVAHYDLYVDGAFHGSYATTATTVTGLSVNRDYAFRVLAVNGAGRPSSPSSTVNVRTLADPGVYTIVTASPLNPDGLDQWYVTTPMVTLAARPSTVTAYTNYEWDGSVLASYTVGTPVSPSGDGTHTLTFYSAAASDTANQEATQTLTYKVDTLAPTAPTTLTASALSTCAIDVDWAAGSDTVSGVSFYVLWVDGSPYGSFVATGTTVSGLVPGTEHSFSVITHDKAGRVSSPSDTVSATTQVVIIDTTPLVTTAQTGPSVPDGANDWYVTTPTVTLASAPTTVAAYTFYAWDGSDPATYSAPLPMPSNGTHTLLFWSIDQAHQRTEETTQQLTLKLDAMPYVGPGSGVEPTGTASLDASSTFVTGASVMLNWTPGIEPYSGINHYEIWDAYVGSTFTTSYLVTGLTPDTKYEYKVYGVNNAGVYSSASDTITVTTSPPPIPTAPWPVYAQATGGEHVHVDWQAVSTYVGEVGYEVWRSSDGVTYSSVATLTGQYSNSYVDTGLSSSTRYWYAVSTFDDRGSSSLSDTSTAAWSYCAPTTGRPARPTGLAAIDGSGSVTLTWQPSLSPAVVSYVVTRADRSLGAVTTYTPDPLALLLTFPSFEDTAAVNGQTYFYAVRAIDASGTVGYPSVEKQAKPHESSSGADPHLVLSSGEGTSCAGCHSVHHAPAAGTRIGWNLMWTVSGPNEDMMCLRCHSVNSGLASTDTSSVIGDPLNLSAMPVWTSADATTTGSITCSSCHAAIAKEGSPTVGLVSAGGTGMIHVGGVGGDASCYACHGSGTSLPFGDMTVFENSAHVAVPDPPSGSKVKCVACHDIPASRNLRLQKYADFMLCVQCHDAPSGGEPSIWEKLQLNEDANAKHPLLPQDQSTGARMSCENCHNSMALTLSNPLVNPRDPGPSGIWAGDGTQRSFCFQCHNGATLPTSVEATPWAGPILARGGETTTCDIQTAYETNIHGAGASIDTSADAFLRADMGYVTDTVLDCSACHDPHGTSNNYALKDSVTSADGQMTESGLSVYRIPAGGYDTRFFCASCHIITPEAHTLAAPASGVDLNQFPIDCTSCHRHIKGVYQDDLL